MSLFEIDMGEYGGLIMDITAAKNVHKDLDDPPENYTCSVEIIDAVDAVVKIIMELDKPSLSQPISSGGEE